MPLEKTRYESFVMPESQDDDFFSLYELYHENSKLDPEVSVPDFKRIAEIRNNPAYISVMAKAFKEYPGCPVRPLPMDAGLGDLTLEEAVRMRRTIRNFTGEAIGEQELSALLMFSNGITGQFTYNLQRPEIQYLRASASAGGLYPIEIYPVVMNVTGVPEGLYHYNVRDHALVELKKGSFKNSLPPLMSGQNFTRNCAVLFLLTAIFKRTTTKYGQRGYRFVMLDAGHIGQSMYLAATGLGLGCLGLGGCYDREVEKILDVDGVEESVVYILGVGKAAAEKPHVPPTQDWV